MTDRDQTNSWDIAPGRTLGMQTPRVMTILNLTPDSFYDGGRLRSPAVVVDTARRAVEGGADLLDLGGESTRPGAARIEIKEQIRRVVPAIEAIRTAGIQTPISVDTTRSPVAAAALDAGADIINDVAAGTEDDGILTLAAQRGCGLILMHRLGPPGTDSYSDKYAQPPTYDSVVEEVRAFLSQRLDAAIHAGVRLESVLLDPGLGFGKTVEQNVELVRQTPRLASLGRPILSAASRKSFVGRLSLGRDSEPSERLSGSLAATEAHYHAGARVFRVHDTAEQASLLRALTSGSGEQNRTEAWPADPGLPS